MEDDNIVKVIPTIQQLLTTKVRVSCTENGCTKSFVHSGALRMHTVKSHGLIKTESDKCLFHKKKASDKTVFQFHCPIDYCQYAEGSKKYFTAYSLVKQHYVKVHAERQFKCSQCETEFCRAWELKNHLQRCGVLYLCGTCSVSYTTTETLLAHCKHQNHRFPDEYTKQIKDKIEKKNANKKSKPVQPVVTIVTQPMLLLTVPANEPVQPVRQIKPKPVIQSQGLDISSEVTSLQEQNDGSHGITPQGVRHDALIQTDIYGIDTLALNKNTGLGHKTLYCTNIPQSKALSLSPRQPRKSSGSGQSDCQYEAETIKYSLLGQRKISPKKTLFKRRHSQHGDTRPVSPRRKKMKSSTGIQTSVSMTRKKGTPMVSSTQTTGDYIIETALRHANIQIEKKTVASQVTPRKQSDFNSQFNIFERPKPVLVDSFSQVKQQNIRAETSHNLAESQTMTDLPPSISTQTLQSYLINHQERHSKTWSNFSTHQNVNKLLADATVLNSNNVFDGEESTNIRYSTRLCPPEKQSVKPSKDTIQIYGENLDTSVNYIMPDELQPCNTIATEMNSPSNIIEPSSNIATNINPTQTYETSPMNQQLDFSSSVGKTKDLTTDQKTSKTTNNQISEIAISEPSSTVLEENYLVEQANMTDTEAQTMSASEFDTLLQSSGIFLSSRDLLIGSSKNQSSTATSTQESGTDPSTLAKELDFLGTSTDTIDMNTQTVDLSLFETFVQIDSNTQTGGDGLDFLDMVMTNMETQTLNDDDLASLGLLDSGFTQSSSTSSAIQTLPYGAIMDNMSLQRHSVGVGEFDVDEEPKSVSCEEGSRFVGFSKNTATTSTSPCFIDDNFLQNDSTKCLPVNNSSNTVKAHSKCNHLGEYGSKVRVQTETQTVSQDSVEPLLQTETQTQVESADTVFETINMETQTTFEDLEQLCDWLQKR